jgi:nitrite reductase/ring-hydroxylating ferredoxin subunit
MRIRLWFITAILLIVLVVPVLAGCSNATVPDTTSTTTLTSAGLVFTPAAPVESNKAYKPVWIEATVNGDTVSVPLAAVEQDIMIHFKLQTASGQQQFMVYGYDGKVYVRGNDCVPCKSINFALKGNLLICMSCGTTFDTVTGKGVGSVGSSGCRAYPKEPSAFQFQDGQIIMKTSDLNTAYQNTLTEG